MQNLQTKTSLTPGHCVSKASDVTVSEFLATTSNQIPPAPPVDEHIGFVSRETSTVATEGVGAGVVGTVGSPFVGAGVGPGVGSLVGGLIGAGCDYMKAEKQNGE